MKKFKKLAAGFLALFAILLGSCSEKEEIEITEEVHPTSVSQDVNIEQESQPENNAETGKGKIVTKAVRTPKSGVIETLKPERTPVPKIVKTPVPQPTTVKPTPVPTATFKPVNAFRNIKVTKTGENKYHVTGQARVFEANVSYVVEDGHTELLKGFTMADMGGPEWGNFTFDLEVKKAKLNSTLTLIIFESSPKDGSRQHENFITLP